MITSAFLGDLRPRRGRVAGASSRRAVARDRGRAGRPGPRVPGGRSPIGSAETVAVGGVDARGTAYAGTFLAIVAAAAFGLTLVTALSGGPVRAAPAALAALGGMGLAVTAVDAPVALVGAAIAAAPAPRLGRGPLRPARCRRRSARPRRAPSRLLVGGAALRGARAGPPGLGRRRRRRAGPRPARPRDRGRGQERRRALPRAGRSARRTRRLPRPGPVSRSGCRLGLGLLAVSWSAATFTKDPTGSVRGGRAPTRWRWRRSSSAGSGRSCTRRPSEIAVYSIVADSGFVLLALASRTDAAAVPAREWLLVFVGSKTALVAWAAAITRRYGGAGLSGMRGWLRRSPTAGHRPGRRSPGSYRLARQRRRTSPGQPGRAGAARAAPLRRHGGDPAIAGLLPAAAGHRRSTPSAAVRNGAGDLPQFRRTARAAAESETSRPQAVGPAGRRAIRRGLPRGRPLRREAPRTSRLAAAWRAIVIGASSRPV